MSKLNLPLLILLGCLSAIPLASQAAEPLLRIQELVPSSWIEYPMVSPALPPNYHAREWSPTEQVIWGTEEDLAKIPGTPEGFGNLSELLVLGHSGDVAQIGPQEFSCEPHLPQLVEAIGLQNFKSEKLQWGDYPVLAIEGELPDGRTFRVCWIGLNSPYGLAICVQHYHPEGANLSSQVWSDFLHQTTQLPDYEIFKAQGLDLNEGYTIYTAGEVSFKVIAERRTADGLLAILIEPLTPGAAFEVKEVGEARMGSKWKYGEPCTKIAGVLTEETGDSRTHYGVVTVLTKEVNDFSFPLDKRSIQIPAELGE